MNTISIRKFLISRQVFSVLFTEPTYHTEASTARDGDSGISMGKCIPSSQIKRFIVVARRHGFCFTV